MAPKWSRRNGRAEMAAPKRRDPHISAGQFSLLFQFKKQKIACFFTTSPSGNATIEFDTCFPLRKNPVREFRCGEVPYFCDFSEKILFQRPLDEISHIFRAIRKHKVRKIRKPDETIIAQPPFSLTNRSSPKHINVLAYLGEIL